MRFIPHHITFQFHPTTKKLYYIDDVGNLRYLLTQYPLKKVINVLCGKDLVHFVFARREIIFALGRDGTLYVCKPSTFVKYRWPWKNQLMFVESKGREVSIVDMHCIDDVFVFLTTKGKLYDIDMGFLVEGSNLMNCEGGEGILRMDLNSYFYVCDEFQGDIISFIADFSTFGSIFFVTDAGLVFRSNLYFEKMTIGMPENTITNIDKVVKLFEAGGNLFVLFRDGTLCLKGSQFTFGGGTIIDAMEYDDKSSDLLLHCWSREKGYYYTHKSTNMTYNAPRLVELLQVVASWPKGKHPCMGIERRDEKGYWIKDYATIGIRPSQRARKRIYCEARHTILGKKGNWQHGPLPREIWLEILKWLL